jgi:hypothetical protein
LYFQEQKQCNQSKDGGGPAFCRWGLASPDWAAGKNDFSDDNTRGQASFQSRKMRDLG